jgi:L-arabinokinase
MTTATVVFYVSGHGYGHATRSVAVIRALRSRSPRPLEIRVRSEAPHWIFTQRDTALSCSAAAIDPGVLQPNGLDLDLPGTLVAHAAFVRGWDAAVAREADWIRGSGARLIVGDIPPLAFAAAERAQRPALAIANFSWDWIFADFAEADPRWKPLASRYREAYGRAETLFRLPLHGDLSAFREIVDVPLLVNRSSRSREACRAALGLAPDEARRVVLVSFGGFGSTAPGAGAEERSAYLFVGFGPRPAGFAGDWIALPSPSPIPHEDLIHACDAVLGKPGYGTVAEALAHGTRFLHVERRDFAEVPVLEAGLARHACARRLARADFEAGRWRPQLDALFTAPARRYALPSDGAEVIADAVLTRLASHGAVG